MKRYIKCTSNRTNPNLWRLCNILNDLKDEYNPELKFRVENIYEDYGADMMWDTIVCYPRDGFSWQILSPRQYDRISTMSYRELVDFAENEIFNGDYADLYEVHPRRNKYGEIIEGSSSVNPTEVETPRGKCYVWQDGSSYKVSIEDPRNRITDARKVHTITDCDSEDEAIEVVKKYF